MQKSGTMVTTLWYTQVEMCELKVGDRVTTAESGFRVGVIKKILVEIQFPAAKNVGWWGGKEDKITVAEPYAHKVGDCGATFEMNGRTLTCHLVKGHEFTQHMETQHEAHYDQKTVVRYGP